MTSRLPDHEVAGHGPFTIYLLHGAYGSRQYFRDLIAALVAHGYRAVSYTHLDVYKRQQRGHQHPVGGVAGVDGCHRPVSYTHLDVYKRQPWVAAMLSSRRLVHR